MPTIAASWWRRPGLTRTLATPAWPSRPDGCVARGSGTAPTTPSRPSPVPRSSCPRRGVGAGTVVAIAIAIGNELVPRRTGAIGAVAADALAPSHAGVVAIIGSGTQAYTQLWALAAVRDLREVRVYSRDPARRAAFAKRVAPLVEGSCRPTPHARAAIEGAQIVILATNSSTPVIDASWIGPGTYVTTLGPKQQGRAEFGPDLPEAASLLVTDSPEQIAAYHPPNVLVGTPTRSGSCRSERSAPARWRQRRPKASRCSSRSALPAPKPSCLIAWSRAPPRCASSRSPTETLPEVGAGSAERRFRVTHTYDDRRCYAPLGFNARPIRCSI